LYDVDVSGKRKTKYVFERIEEKDSRQMCRTICVKFRLFKVRFGRQRGKIYLQEQNIPPKNPSIPQARNLATQSTVELQIQGQNANALGSMLRQASLSLHDAKILRKPSEMIQSHELIKHF
jgi:hypothetical protein